ncbi:strawberry notch C-terminal domain-containing protein [Stenomitos frigidus]|uniref:Helicase ATP-binding domain-containing protein n=1 Tax=Stenomitos frigidus ULC18 TaxID=2107698 RepID=A0A2T1EFR9_9CYAN|nr:strawberry notch C-terminal domain-containing protein [Stenomitos frigidus]PSB31590.1 hypothetical protein C7B82_07130 [Stenomitos frigidus ULC18]
MSNAALIDAFSDYFLKGGRFNSIVEARSYASELLGATVERGTKEAKATEETIEASLVRTARLLVDTAETPGQAYERLVDLYERQPNLSTRSSTSIQNQAYSTPVPLGYLVSALAGITPESVVYEPTGGHGALLVEANRETAIVNEIDPVRAADLRAQGFQVTEQDASSYKPKQPVDVIVMNPPFGAVSIGGVSKEWLVRGGAATPAYRTTNIDHAIALHSLQSLKDEGRAVLVLGAPMGQKTGNQEAAATTYNGGQYVAFYKSLYDNYNVTQHFTLTGNLYARQGTSYPVDVIVVDGRGKSSRRLPAAELPQVYSSYETLKELVPNVSLPRNPNRVATSDRGQRDDAGSRDPGAERSEVDPTLAALHEPAAAASGLADSARRESGSSLGADAERRATGTTGRDSTPTDSGVGAGRVAGIDGMGRSNDTAQPGVPGGIASSEALRREGLPLQLSESDDQRTGASGAGTGRDSNHDAERLAGSDGRPEPDGLERQTPFTTFETPPKDRVISMADERPQAKQVAYQAVSRAKPGGTLLPVNMQTSVTSALKRLEAQYGSLDDYVYDRLRIKPEDMPQQFMAEQVDGIALGIANLEKGEGFILGDQTGIGKGFQLAGAIKYARERGYPVIFCTEKPKLLADIVRDLTDLGAHYNILPTANSAKILLPNGDIVRTGANQSDKLKELMAGNDLKDVDIIFTTYSQLQTVKGEDTPRREFLSWAAGRCMLVLDESHNAGGSAKGFGSAGPLDRSDFTRSLVAKAAGGVIFSSATYAKNPHVMGLYASKTGMRFAQDENSAKSLTEMIEEGGVPLQQMIAAKLAESGQYIRRERSFDGIEFKVKVAPVEHQMADNLASVMSRILEFDELKQSAVKTLKKDIRNDAKRLAGDSSVGGAGAESTNFSSLMHNVIGQSLLSIKAEASVQEALESVRNGEKPVLALSNTMGSFIGDTADDQNLQVGDAIDISFGDLMRKYLERSRDVRTKDAFGTTERRQLTNGELGYDAVTLYDETMEMIADMDWSGLPVSPIDYIEQRLQQEGVVVDEITGRTDCIQYEADGTQTYQKRSKSEFKDIQSINGFNDGKLDVLILNRSGSTGISLHASEKVADQRPRRLIVAQPELNIDTFMQTLGRVNRTGQVVQPRYTILTGDVPAEKRPTAILMKKMASLNANTTASRDSNFEMDGVTDFMNEYGDQVVLEIMGNNPELHMRLGSPIDGLTEDSDVEQMEAEGAIRKVTGRIPSLPVAEQEKLYALIERDYNDLVEREQAMGQSILEAETLDLDAKPLARMDLLPAIEGNSSPFAGAVYLDVVDCKSPRMPLPQLAVVNLIRSELELEPVASVDDHDFNALADAAEARRVATIRSFSERTNDYRRRYVARQETGLKAYAVAEGEALTPEQLESKAKTEANIAARISKFDDKIKRQYSAIRQLLQDFEIGKTVRVVGKDGTIYYGVVQKVVDKSEGKGNPATPGNWRLQIQVADGARQITVPFTKVNTSSRGAIRVEAQAADYSGNDIYTTFDLRQNASREKRQIFTGNVIRAFSNFKGKLVNYKDYQGNVRQGLLMRKGFEIEKELAKAPVKMPSASQALAFLSIASRHELKTADQNMTVMRYSNGDLVLTTPRPKDTGGRYYNNPIVLEAAQNEFYSMGNQMAMTVSAERAADVMNALYQQGIGLSAYSELEGARQFLGVEIPKLEALTDEMLASMAPPIEVGDPVVAAKNLQRMFDLPSVTPEGQTIPAAEQLTIATPLGTELPVTTSSGLTAADYEQKIADTLGQQFGQQFFAASGIDLANLVDQPNFAVVIPAASDGVSLSAFLTDGVLTLEQTAGVGDSIALQFRMLDDGINLTATFINGSRQYAPGVAIVPLSDWIDEGYPQRLAAVLQQQAVEQAAVEAASLDAVAVEEEIDVDAVIEALGAEAQPSPVAVAAENIDAYYLLLWAEEQAIGEFESRDEAADFALDAALGSTETYSVVRGDASIRELGLEAISPESFMAQVNANAAEETADKVAQFLAMVNEKADPAISFGSDFRLEFETPKGRHPLVVSRTGETLQFEQSLADGVGVDALSLRFQIQPDNTLLLVGTDIKGNSAFAPKSGTAYLQDWLDSEVPYALLAVIQPEAVAVAAEAEPVAVEDELDVDAVIEAVEAEAVEAEPVAVEDELDVDAVIEAVEAEAALVQPVVETVAEAAIAPDLDLEVDVDAVVAAIAEQAVGESPVPAVVQVQDGGVQVPEVAPAMNQIDTVPIPERNQINTIPVSEISQFDTEKESKPSRDDLVATYRERIVNGDRTKLTKAERQQLIEHFVEALQPLQSQAEIQSLCQAEIALLEEGYAQNSVNSFYLPTYTSAVREAITSGQLALTAETSYLKSWEKRSGEKGETQTHFALDYLTYDTPTQNRLRGNEALEPVPTVEAIQAEVEAIAPLVEAVPVPTVEAVEPVSSLQADAKRVAEQFSFGRQQLQPEFTNSQLVDRTLLSPELQEYLSFKDQHPDSLLLKPIGSFYEGFFEDAAIVADVIGASLTTRATTPETAHLCVPMAGFPKEDLSVVVPRLEAAGYNVLFTDELAVSQAPVIPIVEAEAVEPVQATPEPIAVVVEPAVESQAVESALIVAVQPLQPTVEQPLPALLVTQQLMEQHDPETVNVMRQAPAKSDRYSPSLGEMRDWLVNAKDLGRDRAYLDRIRTLSDDLLRNSDEVFKPIAERDVTFSHAEFTLSEAAVKAMTRDQTQVRNLEVAAMSVQILRSVGKREPGGQVVFDRGEKGRFRLSEDRKTQTLVVFDKSRNQTILSIVKGKVDHENSAVTNLDHQTFKAFSAVLQKHAQTQKVANAR